MREKHGDEKTEEFINGAARALFAIVSSAQRDVSPEWMLVHSSRYIDALAEMSAVFSSSIYEGAKNANQWAACLWEISNIGKYFQGAVHGIAEGSSPRAINYQNDVEGAYRHALGASDYLSRVIALSVQNGKIDPYLGIIRCNDVIDFVLTIKDDSIARSFDISVDAIESTLQNLNKVLAMCERKYQETIRGR